MMDPAPVPVTSGSETDGPRVCDDMTVEVALAVMASARVEYLIVCDGDDQSTDSVTFAQLAILRDSPTYTDRIRLRDVLDGSLPRPDTRPGGVGEHGRVPSLLVLSH
ncbi:CBS domain-containing protein [Streptantibioticus rubrisoli]|uniref:CBS domain-containing protein n=1 Tax=Streptantibioticus rubrisoli TaxID=1387313 RepID=A0ABT1P6Q4_9ACTN|nr:CBS domain-containing protein [Streptantibioticus rubrisoli]MCQ4041061.1 CBS domain-containing protein [Streptantibioticus rubrisoli]